MCRGDGNYHGVISTVKMQGRSALECLSNFLLKCLTNLGRFLLCGKIKSIGNISIVNNKRKKYIGICKSTY